MSGSDKVTTKQEDRNDGESSMTEVKKEKDVKQEEKQKEVKKEETTEKSNKKPNRRYRKRGVEEAVNATGNGEPDSEEDNRPLAELIQETRDMQRMRQRNKGVDLTVTESSASEAWLASRETSNDATVVSLDETFTLQSSTNPVDQQLERYIQERMKKPNQGGEEEPKKKLTEEDLLYAIPDELKAVKHEVKETQPASTLMTGIVEVELPIEYKLKNIEATEAAKKQMEEIMKNGGEENPQVQQNQGRGRRGKDTATDDLVLERFKKRFRY